MHGSRVLAGLVLVLLALSSLSAARRYPFDPRNDPAPGEATIRLQRAGRPTVTLLDYDGLLTDRTLDVRNGVFQIDGAQNRTPYYLVEY